MLAALSDSQACDNTLQMIDSTIVRVHQHGAGGRGGGIQRICIGRSRGGPTTKVYTRANAEWLVVGFHVMPGQASDKTAYDDLMAEDAPLPEAMLGDKGYDSDAIRSDLERRGIDPVIPTRSNRRAQRTIDKAAYAMRNRIERFFKKIKHSRRVATRYDKLASSFLGFVQLATILCWVRFVRTTEST